MRIPALTLFSRAVRSDVRGVSMMLARTVLMGIVLLSMTTVQATTRYGMYGAPGLHFFSTIIHINFFFILLAGLSYFASAITEEKEELTLGLLKLAGLSPFSILLGKSTSRLCGAALLLLAQFPFTLLAVTLGGVTPLQVVAAYCTLLAFCFLMCNIALLWSVIFRSTVVAATCTAACLMVVVTWPPIFSAIVQGMANSHVIEPDEGWGIWLNRCVEWMTAASPLTRIEEIMRTGFGGFPAGFQVLVNLATGTVFFFLARLVFDNYTRSEIEQAPARVVLTRRGSVGSRVPAAVVGAAAITWKDYRFMVGGLTTLIVKFLLIGGLVAGIVGGAARIDHLPFNWPNFGGGLMVVGMLGFAIDAAFNASRVFRHELRWKTISTLMMLPYSTGQIAYRKVLAGLRSLVPYVVLFIVGWCIFPKPVHEFYRDLHREGMFSLITVFIVVQFFFTLHLVAYLSLVLKRGALPLAIAIQYVGGSFLMVPLTILAAGSRGNVEGLFVFLILVSLGLTIFLHIKIGSRLVRAASED